MSKVITFPFLLILTSTYLKLESITDYMINLEHLLELDGVKAFILLFGLHLLLSVVEILIFGLRRTPTSRWDSSGIWEGLYKC
jgi:hypothetical protein